MRPTLWEDAFDLVIELELAPFTNREQAPHSRQQKESAHQGAYGRKKRHHRRRNL